jgi:HNH endonuclease
MEPKQCEWCGILFVPRYPVTKKYWAKRRFCSDVCRANGHRPPGTTGKIIPLEKRFWSKVLVCEHGRGCRHCCWPWIGSKDKFGYGVLHMAEKPKRTRYRAHRLAYELFIGPLPDGLRVLHDCPQGDNPSCVNYNGHLWGRTLIDKHVDRDAQGRCGTKGGPVADQRGLRNGTARLRDEDIISIRRLYATGQWSQYALAAEFGCGQSHINRIIRGKQRMPVTTP